jgi:hypothetical protein
MKELERIKKEREEEAARKVKAKLCAHTKQFNIRIELIHAAGHEAEHKHYLKYSGYGCNVR